MHKFSKRFTLLLALLLLVSAFGCNGFGNVPATDAPATEAPTDDWAVFATAVPPTATPIILGDEAFVKLDAELFQWYVTQDIWTLNQYCYDPTSFGIDESTVPVTLGDFSEANNETMKGEYLVWLARLQEIGRSLLTEQHQFAYDVYERYFTWEIESASLFYYYEPLDEYVGLQMNLPIAFGLYEFRDEKDVQDYLLLLKDTPRYFAEVLAFEQKRAALGVFMTEDMLDQVLADFDSILEAGDDSYLFATFRDGISDVDWLTDDARESYYAENDAILKNEWQQAYSDLREGLEALRSSCRTRQGAYDVGGDALAYFKLAVKTESANDLSVSDAIDLLKDCTKTLYAELFASAAKAEKEIDKGKAITTGSVAGDAAYLKERYTQIVPALADVQVTYREIPPELQDGFSPAAYLIPTIDNCIQNVILINPSSDTDLSTMAHEGFPGHMYQYVYQFSDASLPLFQKVIVSNGYCEGWSTNAEWSIAKVADDFNSDYCVCMFDNDMLTNMLIATCSLMINGLGASDKDVGEYLSTYGLDAYSYVIYDLAVDMPIYYFKYVLGFAALYELRDDCDVKMGTAEAVAFNQAYLDWGAGYYDLLEPLLDDWADAYEDAA